MLAEGQQRGFPQVQPWTVRRRDSWLVKYLAELQGDKSVKGKTVF